jgi:hypothetical protein
VSDLSLLAQVLELGLALDVELIQILFEGLEEEILGLVAHDLDLASDPLVHFLLSFDGFLSV